MTTTATATVTAGLSASAERRDRTLVATLAGTADLTVKPALDQFMTSLHETARTNATSEVLVDFTALAFMNSSCLKAFVTWICMVQDMPSAAQYRIVLLSSATAQWQQRSLHALACLAPELVTLKNA